MLSLNETGPAVYVLLLVDRNDQINGQFYKGFVGGSNAPRSVSNRNCII
jgi:hypothetical protein